MKDRIVNGYKLIYKPDYYLSYRQGNHKGYIYEHIYVATKTLKRRLHPYEVVHHLDLNKLNNDRSNLIVLSKTDHILLHNWLRRAMVKNGLKNKSCTGCGKDLILTLHYRTPMCRNRHVDALASMKFKPNKELLIFTLKQCNSILEVAKLYKVSDNNIRKWCRKYGISTKIKDYK